MLLIITSDEMEDWKYIVREETRLCCTHISDVEGDGEDFSEDCETRDGCFDRLTLCARYAAQLERGETCFELRTEELPAFRSVLCAQMQAEGETQRFVKTRSMALRNRRLSWWSVSPEWNCVMRLPIKSGASCERGKPRLPTEGSPGLRHLSIITLARLLRLAFAEAFERMQPL